MTACLYVMGMPGGPVKIGSTTNAVTRLYHVKRQEKNQSIVMLRTFDIAPGWALAAERYVHWQLRKFHFRGEWFHVSPEVALAAIRKAVRHDYALMEFDLIPPLTPRGRPKRKK